MHLPIFIWKIIIFYVCASVKSYFLECLYLRSANKDHTQVIWKQANNLLTWENQVDFVSGIKYFFGNFWLMCKYYNWLGGITCGQSLHNIWTMAMITTTNNKKKRNSTKNINYVRFLHFMHLRWDSQLVNVSIRNPFPLVFCLR